MNWNHDLSQAPRDGTHVILAMPNKTTLRSYWCEPKHEPAHWCMLSHKNEPVAWMAWPEHPFASATTSEDALTKAQTHAIEARGANATINEIYQIISGGKGEPGNWNGAEPVRRYAEAAEAEVKRLQAEIDRKSSMPSDHRYWEGRYRDEAADNEKLRGVVERAQSIVSTSIYPSWHDTARTALASTGGEHHAE